MSEETAHPNLTSAIERSPAGLFACIVTGGIILWCLLCRSGFTIETYPWFFPDSYDWIVNGLAYASPPLQFDISHRGLLFTLIMAGLYRVGFPDLIVLSGTFAFLWLLIVAGWGLAKLGAGNVASFTVILLSLSHPLVAQSAFVGSDVLACVFLSGLTLSFLRFSRFQRPVDLIAAGAWAGLGIHSQYIEVVWLPVLALVYCFQESEGTTRIVVSRIPRLALSRVFWTAIFVGLLMACLPVIPRYLVYGEIYSSRVTHLPLVHPNLVNLKPYAVGMVGQIGWPIVGLALVGFAFGILKTRYRILSLAAALWILAIGGFFVFLYTWYDCRFAIYIAVPVSILAAIALQGLLETLRSLGTHGKATTHAFLLCVVGISVTQLFRPDTNMFSDRLQLTPWSTLIYDRENGIRIEPHKTQLALKAHLEESLSHKLKIASNTLETLGHSQNVATLFHELRSIPGRSVFIPPPLYAEFLQPDQTYFVKNRNVIYFGSRVDTRTDIGDVIGSLKAKQYEFGIASDETLRKLFTDVPSNLIISRAGNYALIELAAMVEKGFLRQLPPTVEEVSAPGNPYALFDGIGDNAANYGSAPLGVPIVIRLRKETRLSTIKIHLYDFDERRYEVAVTGVNGSERREMYRSPGSGDRGLITIPVPAVPMNAIEIVGITNSDTVNNPGNTMLHVTEIELGVP